MLGDLLHRMPELSKNGLKVITTTSITIHPTDKLHSHNVNNKRDFTV